MIKVPTEKRVMTKEALADEKKHIDMFNEAFAGVELTPAEERTFQWLAGWETAVVRHIISVAKKSADLSNGNK